MIVVGEIMLMSMHRPKDIDFETVGMTMVFDHLEVVLNGVQKFWCMGSCGKGRPGKQADAKQCRKALAPTLLSLKHGSEQAEFPRQSRVPMQTI